eukprot:TRINITY_DN15174_c1_g2_i1.p1 TRINITY_DN15174_c1_g2~~TRINITY_DN15174_c1_g2_i1.p1  ORF type:complete len:481 (+),score=20.47 TRINITY_DN15174_c1_g2_i1:22-1464(+)
MVKISLILSCFLSSAGVSTADAPPNILLLFPDQWRFDWAGFQYPHTSEPLTKIPLSLPTVASVAARGVRFTQAYVPSPLCSPSRSSLASGREYDRAGVLTNFDNDYPVNQTTFYTLLRNSGYHTMTTGKDDLTKKTQLGSTIDYKGCTECKPGDGLFHQAELGFSDGLRYSGKEDVVKTSKPHEMYGFHLARSQVHTEEGNTISGWEAHRACMGLGPTRFCDAASFPQNLYEDDYTAQNAIKLLRRRPRDRPFFLQVSFPGPHDPFLVTAPMSDSVASREWPNATDSKQVYGGKCPATHEPANFGSARRCDYAAEIENLDRLFKLVLDEVEAQGATSNTLICISSDHGELLGDHNDFGKSKPWQGAAVVPLICAGPGVRTNEIVTKPVGTLDLAGTFLDYAHVAPDPGMTVKSLRKILEGRDGSYRDVIHSGLNNWRMLIHRSPDDNKTYKLICCKGLCPGAPQLFPKRRCCDLTACSFL